MPKILEHELRDYLASSVGAKCFLDDDEIYSPTQIEVSELTIGNYGRADVVYFDIEPKEIAGDERDNLFITILELKEGNIDFGALGQICRYRRGLLNATKSCYSEYNVSISGYLVGNQYANGDICYVAQDMRWLMVYFYELNLESGVKFVSAGRHSLKEEGNLESPMECLLDKHNIFMKNKNNEE